MHAISTYSGKYHEKLNGLLCDEREKFDYRKDKESIADALFQSVFCASGLRKLPLTDYDQSYRGTTYDVQRLHDYIKAVVSGQPIELHGFTVLVFIQIHTILDGLYQFSNLKGMYIEPISANPHELEFLLSQTQAVLVAIATR